jgi:parvulin-like peptidyl-prolyl isomerase
MKKALILLLFLIVVQVDAQTNEPAIATGKENSPQITAIDGYAARVNNSIITYGDVRESITPYVRQLAQRYQGKELAEQMQKAYVEGREALIEEALLKDEAKRRELALPPDVIEDEVKRLIRERFDNDRALLTRALASRRMTLDEWKKEVAEQLTLRVFYSQEVTRLASVSDQAVRDEYERIKTDYFIPFRVKYRFILVSKGKTEEEQVVKREQAENTLKKLRNGADFVKTAEEVSEGDTSLSPWRDPADVLPILRPVLKDTPAGVISDLVETDDLFYIVKIEKRREEGYVPLEEVRKDIYNRLLETEHNRLHKDLMERIAKNHFVERY